MKNILLTRAFELNWEDQQLFQKMGYQTTILPLTEIHFYPIIENSLLLTALNQADWLFFTSQSSVAAVLPHASKKLKIAVIGEKTAESVRSLGFSVDFISPVARKTAFIAAWEKTAGASQKIFYPKSQLADSFLEEELGKRHQVSAFVVYENRFPKAAEQDLQQLFTINKIDSVYITSPSSWKRFFKVYQNYPDRKIDILVIGETTRNAVEKSGYSAQLLAEMNTKESGTN